MMTLSIRKLIISAVVAAAALALVFGAKKGTAPELVPVSGSTMSLPKITDEAEIGLDEALRLRRSLRTFAPDAIDLKAAAALLWAAHGVSAQGHLTVPSAGALYPLEIYLVADHIEGLHAGIYRYNYRDHALEALLKGTVLKALASACFSQNWVSRAAAAIIITAVYERTTRKYGSRGERYVHLEAGHAAQNIYLKAAALGLGTTEVGAFDDNAVKRVLGLPPQVAPLAIMPVGKPN